MSKVSVIIPVYNTPEAYLRQCLDSVVGQTLAEIQIICVDDCSSDGSLAILQDYAQKDSRVLVVQHQKNQGISVARNTGVEYVKGEYLYFIDCDDYIEPNTFAELYPLAVEKNLDVLLFQPKFMYETERMEQEFSKKIDEVRYGTDIHQVKTGQTWFFDLQKIAAYSGCTWIQLIKTSHYRENKLYFHPLTSCGGEDWVFSLDNFFSAQRMAGVAKTYYNYRIRENSGSTGKKPMSVLSAYVCSFSLMLMRVKSATLSPEEDSQIQAYLDNLALIGGKYYGEITGLDPSKAEETLLNLKNLVFHKPLVSLPRWEDFSPEGELCFFGAGYEGKRALALFRQQGWKLPLAFCDNNPETQGKQVEGIPVLSLEKALNYHPDTQFLITNRRSYGRIHAQIAELVGEDRILSLSY